MEKLKKIALEYHTLLILSIVAILSVANICNGRDNNYHIFFYGSTFFWQGINPYDHWNAPFDVFVYGPLFCVLFTPFTWLPVWLGSWLWNMLSTWLLTKMIYMLPHIDREKQNKIFWYVFLLILQSIVSSQYNVYVAVFFLAAFVLLERGEYFWAILIMCISGYTKIYGFFELILLLFYPYKLRNLCYTIFVLVALFFVPLIKIPIGELVYYYQSWIAAIFNRHGNLLGTSIFTLLNQISPEIFAYKSYIQVFSLILLLLTGLLVYNQSYTTPQQKIRTLALVMIWVILFSNAAEPHTHLISIIGLMYAFMFLKPSKIKTLYLYVIFFLFCIVPVDVFFPPRIAEEVVYKYGINTSILLLGWLYIIYIAIRNRNALSLDNQNVNFKVGG